MKYEDLSSLIQETMQTESLIFGSFSKVRSKSDTEYRKVTVRPISLQGRLTYQFTYEFPQKVHHKNHTPAETSRLIMNLLQNVFRQGMLFTVKADVQILVSKKGKVTILKRPPSRELVVETHDRQKNYVLQEGTVYPFLVELGVMNKSGRVLAKRYDKFRQLNKFLEIVTDCLPYLQQPHNGETLTVLDFGSGKAYLTFALYHYLVSELGLKVQIIGLDLKKDVVEYCNRTAQKLDYTDLEFLHEDIRVYERTKKVDLVVSLHACNTATDYALAKAVQWDAQVILAVPCCQHELYNQVQNPLMTPLLEHGIIKERAAALLTDAARAKLLESVGYSVQIMEFIDMEHTPKNLLIRAFRGQKRDLETIESEYEKFREFWNIEPTLEFLLKGKCHGH